MAKKRKAGVVINNQNQPSNQKKKSNKACKSAYTVDQAENPKQKTQNPFSGEVNLLEFNMLEWMLWPITIDQFFSEYWEKKPLHVKRDASYYEGLFTRADVDTILKEQELQYEVNINLAKVDKDGKKVMHNEAEKGEVAEFDHVTAKWNSGVSIQFMHPQISRQTVRNLLSSLENKSRCLWGANAYFTPPKAQGFAPHYDDVEVFMLQLEGSKHWILSKPPTGEDDNLPREYSRDFHHSELGETLFDDVISTGDLLYMPRGTVHAGIAQDCMHSSHLTVSAYQKEAWCDFLVSALPKAIEKAALKDAEFRKGLPFNYLGYMGKVNDSSQESEKFSSHVKDLVTKLANFVDCDEAADELGSDFIVARLNPVEDHEDEFGPSPIDVAETAFDIPKSGLYIRWRDPTWQRLIMDVDPESGETQVLLNHCLGNNITKHMSGQEQDDDEVGSLRFEAMFFEPLRQLFKSREYVKAADLPGIGDSDRLALLDMLFEEGLLQTKVQKK